MPEWNDLISLEGEQSRGLEALAYQTASVLHARDGELVRVDDRGGGDGVEFYVVLPNGEEWGWQTKLFLPGDRLREGGRKRQIERSLERALAVHPNLSKWTLCTPMDFTTGEHRWFTDELRQVIPADRTVDLVHWDGASFIRRLAEPSFEGARRFDFGELELGLDWFRRKLDSQMASLAGKVIPSLHIPSHVDAVIGAMLADGAAIAKIDQQVEEVDELIERRRAGIASLVAADVHSDDWQKVRDHILAVVETSTAAVESARNLVATARVRLAQGRKDILSGLDPNAARHELTNADQQFELNLGRLRWDSEAEPDTDPYASSLRRINEHVHELYSLGWRIWYHLDTLFTDLDATLRSTLHVFGPAGAGKTHLAFGLCRDRLDRGLPSLIVQASRIATAEPLEAQLLRALDVPPVFSWADFLGALDAAAVAYRTRVPIVIDALNEATIDGRLSPVWTRDIPDLVAEIARYPSLALVTTCRSSYLPAIWPTGRPEGALDLDGFDEEAVETAVARYFDYYRIVGDTTLATLAEFRLPLYLRLYCEATNHDRATDVPAYVGQESLFAVLDRYLTVCNAAVSNRLGKLPSARLVQEALTKLAAYLWTHRERVIPLGEAFRLVDDLEIGRVDVHRSLLRAILDEGLLIDRDWFEYGEVLTFTYDLLAGYLIATQLIGRHADAMGEFLSADVAGDSLFGAQRLDRRPLADDIGRCLAALIPARFPGLYLHDFSDDPRALELSVASLFEIAPEAITQGAVDFVAELFSRASNRPALLDLAMSAVAHVGHPFNAAFWSEQLGALVVADRDFAWSEHVRHHREHYEVLVTKFEAASRDGGLTDLGRQRLHLLAPLLRWCLTSTVRPFRDRVTRALYCYGLRWPRHLLDLARASLPIDDPYVPERMLAALYGVAMARQWDFADPSFATEVLPACGRALYDAMFRPGAQHATTHTLARDYARLTIEIALLHHPDLLTAEERKRISPPFADGGVREWGRDRDRNRGQYRGGNRPIGVVDHNPLNDLGVYGGEGDWADAAREAEEQLWWRIYGLGYSLDLFGEIDQELSSLDGRMGGHRFVKRVDGYGAKYCRIATLELAGLRDDLGLIERWSDRAGERLSLVDIDPSFPEPEPDRPVISADFLGDRSLSLQDWILNGEAPDLGPYLVVGEVDGEPGPWVLVDGYVNQEEPASHRNLFVFPRGLLVPAATVDAVVAHLERQDLGGRWLPDVPHDAYRFGGEVPWCETYPPNGPVDLDFEVDARIVTAIDHEVVITRDGVEVPPGTAEFARLLAANLSARRNPAAAEPGVTVERVEVEKERREPIYATYAVTLPVREDRWEDYHSVVNPGRSVDTPTREITEVLGLVGRPQTFDLFEQIGSRASITVASGEPWHTTHKLTYLRQDLLDRYLAEAAEHLVWGIWGERTVVPASLSNYLPEVQIETQYLVFQEIRRYGGGVSA